LLEEFLSPLNISQARLSEELKVPVSRVNAIIRGRVAITINTGLRLSRFFCATDGFWLHLQVIHDLKKAKKLIGKKIRSDVRIHKPKIN
jgi:addiction module HigA family antidote